MSKTFSLGLFVFSTLTVLAAGVFLIGRKQLHFSSSYRVHAEFRNVTGLSEGGDVRVGGLHAGTVRRIVLPKRPDGSVTVVMDLERATREVVRKDSTAAIKSEGLLGDKYVEISFGSPDAPPPDDDEALAGEPPLDIAGLIKKTDEILDSTKDAMRNVQSSAEGMKSITAKIDQGKGTAGALINDNTIYQKASEGAAAFADNMEALRHNFLLRGFFKRRGFEDSGELARHEIPGLPVSPPVKTFRYAGRELFDKPETAKLSKREGLKEAGTFLETHPYGLAVVTASVGMKGDSDQKRELTQAQAMVVRDYLAQNFRLDDTRVKTMGLGKTAQENDGSQLEILIYPAGVAAPTVRAASGKPAEAR